MFLSAVQKRTVDKSGNVLVYQSDMEEFLGCGMQFFNGMEASELEKLKKLFDQTMQTANHCLGQDGFRIPSDGKIKRPISMTLFETLFYYYTLFGESDDYVSMRKGIQELLDDTEYLKVCSIR